MPSPRQPLLRAAPHRTWPPRRAPAFFCAASSEGCDRSDRSDAAALCAQAQRSDLFNAFMNKLAEREQVSPQRFRHAPHWCHRR
jgi:hypothetical protein